MATLEQIINEGRSLSPAEKQKLRQILDLESEQSKAYDRAERRKTRMAATRCASRGLSG